MGEFVALLRAINVGGHRKLPMVELRELAETLGLEQPRTYIQSGNLIFGSKDKAPELEAKLEAAIQKKFGIAVPVIIRPASKWNALVAANPFPDVAEAEPNRLMMMLSKSPPAPGVADALAERSRDGERIRAAGGALWIHYPGGAGTSKLAPSLIDRAIGSPATARNWRTVLKLQEMLSE